MTVWTDPIDQDNTTIDAAVAVALGKKPDIAITMVNDGAGIYPAHLVDSQEINKDNLCEFVTKLAPKGWVTVKDVWPDNPDACK